MNLDEYKRKRLYAYSGGIAAGGSPADESRLTFIGNESEIRKYKLREHRIWYNGDSDELLNFFTKNGMIDLNLEPWYFRNKKSSFWCVSASEDDVKRTHSGQPYNIVTTMVGLVGIPDVKAGKSPKSSVFRTGQSAGSENPEDDKLAEILDGCGFWDMYANEQMPLTLVDGWGAYKVSWDLAFSDHPYVSYYDAENVDFCWRAGKVVGMMFTDWYVGEDGRSRYLVTEFRYINPRRDAETGLMTRDLTIEKKAWGAVPGDETQMMEIADIEEKVPALKGAAGTVMIRNFDRLLATPCVFYRNAADKRTPGRSIFEGKEDLFDDLDQELSQKSNTVRRSTPEELWNSDFMERDAETGLPIQPKVYDRKFLSYAGGRDANGAVNTSEPVQVTHPNVNIAMYSDAAITTLSQILAGILSPATMGIGVAAMATQESQREKEKITVTTRNHLIKRETDILESVMSDLLCCEEYLRTGCITRIKYDVSIKFSEFADNTFEEKSAVLADALVSGSMSPEMYMDKLYGDSLSEDDYRRELEYLKQRLAPPPQEGMGDMPPELAGMMGG